MLSKLNTTEIGWSEKFVLKYVISNFDPQSEGNNQAAIIYDPVNGSIYYDPKSPLNDAVKIAEVDENTFDVNNPLEDTDFEIF